MANTLTSLIPDVYAALDVVSRELVGFISAVQRDPKADRVALNQTLRSIAAPSNTGGANITAAMSLPSASDQTIANKSMTISKSRYFPFSWTGEEQYSMDSGGPGYLTIEQGQIAQALRAAVNEIENDLADEFAAKASRAYGVAATDPFASNLADVAQVKKILDDNGAPASDRHLVISTGAGAALRTLSNFSKVNEAGTAEGVRRGVLLDVHDFAIRESAQINSATAGTASGSTTNSAGYSVGDVTLTLASAGTGTVLAGDVVTFAGDTNKYVITTGDADVSNGGTIVLSQPGLRVAMSAATKAITVVATSARNVGFTRNSMVLATRLPVIPKNGDMATDRETITDPLSGISFELAYYPGFRMGVYHLSINWGYMLVKPEHAAVLLGA